MVSTININACKNIIRMWKIAQPICSKPPTEAQTIPPLYKSAIRIKIISPAYKFPNSRKANETGLDMSEIPSNSKLAGMPSFPKGWKASSPKKPPTPLVRVCAKEGRTHPLRGHRDPVYRHQIH